MSATLQTRGGSLESHCGGKDTTLVLQYRGGGLHLCSAGDWWASEGTVRLAVVVVTPWTEPLCHQEGEEDRAEVGLETQPEPGWPSRK